MAASSAAASSAAAAAAAAAPPSPAVVVRTDAPVRQDTVLWTVEGGAWLLGVPNVPLRSGVVRAVGHDWLLELFPTGLAPEAEKLRAELEGRAAAAGAGAEQQELAARAAALAEAVAEAPAQAQAHAPLAAPHPAPRGAAGELRAPDLDLPLALFVRWLGGEGAGAEERGLFASVSAKVALGCDRGGAGGVLVARLVCGGAAAGLARYRRDVQRGWRAAVTRRQMLRYAGLTAPPPSWLSGGGGGGGDDHAGERRETRLGFRLEFRLPEPPVTNVEPGGARSGAAPNATLAALGALLDSGARTDVHLEVDGAALPAHRFVLALHSPVFRAMFASGMAEAEPGSRVVIEGVGADVLGRFLRFLYTGACDWAPPRPPLPGSPVSLSLSSSSSSPSSSSSSSSSASSVAGTAAAVASDADAAGRARGLAAELLTLADRYGVDHLRAECARRLARELTVPRALDCLVLAEACHEPGLRAACLAHLAADPARVEAALREPAFAALSAAQVAALLAATTPAGRAEAQAQAQGHKRARTGPDHAGDDGADASKRPRAAAETDAKEEAAAASAAREMPLTPMQVRARQRARNAAFLAQFHADAAVAASL